MVGIAEGKWELIAKMYTFSGTHKYVLKLIG